MYSVIGTDGQVYGPVNMDTLSEWCKQGRINPDTNLIDPIDGRVMRARQVPGLDSLFAILPQGAPPLVQPPNQAQGPLIQQGPRPGNQYGQVPIQINNYVGPMYPHPQLPTPYAPQRNKVAAILLALFLGCFGVHRFYMGHNGSGTAMLLLTVMTCGYGAAITVIWSIVDIILIATGGLLDGQNQPLT